MSAKISQDQRLESILFKLLDDDSRREGADQAGTAILLSLLNLLGLVSIMASRPSQQSGVEQQSRDARNAQAPNPTEQIMSLLMNAMGHRQTPGQPAPGPGINPALLLGLLGNQGGRPDQMGLLNMLAGLMSGQGSPATGSGPSAAPKPGTAQGQTSAASSPCDVPSPGSAPEVMTKQVPAPAYAGTPEHDPAMGGSSAVSAVEVQEASANVRGKSEVAEKPPAPELPFDRRGHKFNPVLRWDRRLG